MPQWFDPNRPIDGLSRLALVRAKVERAKQDLADMEARLEEFYGQMSTSDSDSDVTHVFVGSADTIRVTFDALCAASDVISNLRGALDHLIFQLIDVHSPNSDPEVFERCAFPICDDQAGYEAAKGRKVKGISPKAMEILDACKPYKEGDNPLWELDDLNNIGKHRLILTVGKDVFCHAEWVGKLSVTQWFRYKFDDPHFAGIYGPKMDQDRKLAIEESLGQTQVIRCDALLPKLHQFVDFIDALIYRFLPVLR
jgi:hypothetical protein